MQWYLVSSEELLAVKHSITLGILFICSAFPAHPQKSLKPSSMIRIEFSINRVSRPCKWPNIRITVAGKDVSVERIRNGFIVPNSLLALYEDPTTRKLNNVSIHLACGEMTFDLGNEYPVRLLPGLWKFRILYPDSWARDELYPQLDLSGKWLRELDFECDECEPCVVVWESINTVPQKILKNLERMQSEARGERAMEIAFALTVFQVNYESNRDYLLDLWRTCLASPDKPAIVGICDETRLSFILANLYFRGDETLLPVLLHAAESKSYAAEELGHFYAVMLKNQPEKLLDKMNGLPASTQSAICRDAMDNFYLDTPEFKQVESHLLDLKQSNAEACLKAMREAK